MVQNKVVTETTFFISCLTGQVNQAAIPNTGSAIGGPARLGMPKRVYCSASFIPPHAPFCLSSSSIYSSPHRVFL